MAGRYLEMIRAEIASSPVTALEIPNSWKPQNVPE